MHMELSGGWALGGWQSSWGGSEGQKVWPCPGSHLSILALLLATRTSYILLPAQHRKGTRPIRLSPSQQGQPHPGLHQLGQWDLQ